MFFVLILANSCKKDKKTDSTTPTPIAATDADGNGYHSVTIGTQVWMVENLKTTKYRDGLVIPNVTDAIAWFNLATGAYSNYNNDADNSADYGRLYNWYAVNTGSLCPTGWHVPTDSEWTTLTTYLGGENVAGGKLKEIGTIHWKSPNTGATNEKGFTGLPGGYHHSNGTFVNIGDYGYWWSFTENDTGNAWYRNLSYGNGGVGRYYNLKRDGLSVRCLKD